MHRSVGAVGHALGQIQRDAMLADARLIHKALHQRHAAKGATGLSEYSISRLTITAILPYLSIPRTDWPDRSQPEFYCLIRV